MTAAHSIDNEDGTVRLQPQDLTVDVDSLRVQRDIVLDLRQRQPDDELEGLVNLLDYLLDVAEGHAR